MNTRRLFGICLIALLAPLTFIGAQESEIGPGTISNIVYIIVTPEHPGPNSRATVSVEGSGLDLDSADITWTVGGVRFAGGQGLKRVEITTGPTGSRTTISVSIDTGDRTVTKSITLTNGEVDLLWQGETYTPPFYRGRSLWTNQSRITFLAIPSVTSASGATLNRANLIYRWTKDGEVLGSSSGTGKNTLTLSDSILSLTSTIGVEVLTDQDTVAATASLIIGPIEPSILVYEDNPLYGLMLHREINGEVTFKEQEISFAAIPLFMSVDDRHASVLSYAWSTNSTSAKEVGSKVTYRAPENTKGNSRVTARVDHTRRILQTATKNFVVQFGND